MLSGKRRKFLVAGTIFLPWAVRRRLYNRLLGWQLSPSARIGLSYIDVAHVRMAEGTRIGHFNVFRNVPLLHMGEGSVIGHWNWLTATEEFNSPAPPTGGFRGLKVGSYSAILSRHYLDCVGGITLGPSAVIAGVRSTFMTHQVDTRAGHVVSAPIWIGEYCLISSDVRFAPGAVLPARSVVAMGAVVVGELKEEGALYGGVPAKIVRRNVGQGGWFIRQRGILHPAPGERRE